MRKVSQGGRDDVDADVGDDDDGVGDDDDYVRDVEKDHFGLILFHHVTFLFFDVPLNGPSVWTLSPK